MASINQKLIKNEVACQKNLQRSCWMAQTPKFPIEFAAKAITSQAHLERSCAGLNSYLSYI